MSKSKREGTQPAKLGSPARPDSKKSRADALEAASKSGKGDKPSKKQTSGGGGPGTK